MHQRGEECRDERGTWDFGGGQLEMFLSLEENVLKELKEEYGCKGEIQEQLPAHPNFRIINGIKTHWLVIPFFVKVDLKKVKIQEPGKMAKIDFFTLDNLPRPLHSGVKKTMKLYAPYFEKYRR